MNTLSGEKTDKTFCPHLKSGSKFYSYRVDPFQKGLGVQESKQEVTKFDSLVNNGKKITKCIQLP